MSNVIQNLRANHGEPDWSIHNEHVSITMGDQDSIACACENQPVYQTKLQTADYAAAYGENQAKVQSQARGPASLISEPSNFRPLACK